MESSRYPVSQAAVAEVVPARSAIGPVQAFGVFLSHLAAVFAITALGAAFVTVALIVLVMLAPLFVMLFVHLVRRHDRMRVGVPV
jgi:hypothetical protein